VAEAKSREPSKPFAAPPPEEEEAPISAAPNTPPMPHVLASRAASRSLAPAEPTQREPAVERRREREERTGAQTLHLGSGVPDEVQRLREPPSQPAAASSSGLGSTQRLSSGGTQPLDISAHGRSLDPTPTKPAKQAEEHARQRGRADVAHEALHDDFFDAGDQGTYEGGQGLGHAELDDDLEDQAVPRVVVRTPEQEQRRNRMMQVVGIVVGVVLGVLVFAMLRGRGGEPKPAIEAPAAQPATRAEAPAPVEPPPPPAAQPPAPPVEPPPVEPPPVEPPPEEKRPAEKRSAEKAPASKPGSAPHAGPAGPRTEPAPRPPVPATAPGSRPAKASFPD
jgi:hypothetical protein